MGDHEDAEAEGSPPSFLAAPARAGYYFWYAHVPHTPWEGVPLVSGKYPVGLFDQPTTDIEHAGGIHSVHIPDTIGELLAEDQPALALEWSVSTGQFWNNAGALGRFLNEHDELFP